MMERNGMRVDKQSYQPPEGGLAPPLDYLPPNPLSQQMTQ